MGYRTRMLWVPGLCMIALPSSVILLASLFDGAHLVLRTSASSPSANAGGNVGPSPTARNSLQAFPSIMLWAWEHPEDLSFIDPHKVGVAFLASTLYLRGDNVLVRPRVQPMRVPPGTVLLAVARIEADPLDAFGRRADFSPRQRAQAAAAIAVLGRIPEVRGVQIDFDASVSERPFYRDLLADVRQQLPQSAALSMTALASLCAGDPWISGLVVDEAVPMLFRMGPDRQKILGDLAEGHGFAAAVCAESVGISTDEPLPSVPRARRLYVFRPAKWSPTSVHEILRRVNR